MLTCSLTKEEIVGFRERPMQVPYFCLHTQGIERVVKEVTNASGLVYDFERRDGFIRGRVENRSLMSALTSKKSLGDLLIQRNRKVGARDKISRSDRYQRC